MNRQTPSKNRRHNRSAKDNSSPKSTPLSRQRGSAAQTNDAARALEAELVRFHTGDRSIDFNVDVTEETVWATQQQIADLFGKDVAAIDKHIQNIKDDNELSPNIRKFRVGRKEGTREVGCEIEHYDLDTILAVGHRVKSPQAAAFRKWAYQVLKSYLTSGYALNETRLKRDPAALDDLAAKLRAIRAEEKHLFAKVREFFKEASSDYDGSANFCRSFFALLQDKFHFAASGLTACQLVLERADHRHLGMGMTTFAGDIPTVEEAKVGKNYLSQKELHVLRIVSEQFLLYVESKAVRGLIMTMKELAGKFDELLRVNGYEVFIGYEGRDYQRDHANRHAIAEFARFLVRQRKIA